MAEDLDMLMRSVQGDSPSPEFVAALRERVIAESGQPIVLTVEPVVAVVPRDRTAAGGPGPTQLILAAAAAITLIVGFVILSASRNDGSLDTINPPEEMTTTTVPSTTVTTTAEPASFAPDATSIPTDVATLGPGTYRVDTVGTPFSFTSDQPLAVRSNQRAYLELTHPGSQGFNDRELTFMRLSALSDPTQLATVVNGLGDPWPVGDVAGWLDNLPDEIAVSDREEAILGGLESVRFELAAQCPATTEVCMYLGTNRQVITKSFEYGGTFQVWIVDQGDEDPLAVIAGVRREADFDWFTAAEGILSTLAFGEVGPNPILDAQPGAVELPFLGGIRIDLAEGSYAIRNPGGFDQITLAEWEAVTEFLANPFDGEGKAVEAVAELVTALQTANVEVTEIEPTLIHGLEARVFDIGGSASEQPALRLDPDADGGWRAPTQGRIWVFDHPERGLLMVTAEAFENIEIVFPLALAQTQAIVNSLEFIERN